MVQLLLAYNADVNARTAYGRTPLERAAKSGHIQIVELLLAHNADVNAATCGGETPLLVAASGNHRDIVQLLLSHGADVHTTSQLGFTAQRIATLQGFTEIVQLLSAQTPSPAVGIAINNPNNPRAPPSTVHSLWASCEGMDPALCNSVQENFFFFEV